jgi:hypothetical protein
VFRGLALQDLIEEVGGVISNRSHPKIPEEELPIRENLIVKNLRYRRLAEKIDTTKHA